MALMNVTEGRPVVLTVSILGIRGFRENSSATESQQATTPQEIASMGPEALASQMKDRCKTTWRPL